MYIKIGIVVNYISFIQKLFYEKYPTLYISFHNMLWRLFIYHSKYIYIYINMKVTFQLYSSVFLSHVLQGFQVPRFYFLLGSFSWTNLGGLIFWTFNSMNTAPIVDIKYQVLWFQLVKKNSDYSRVLLTKSPPYPTAVIVTIAQSASPIFLILVPSSKCDGSVI